MKFGHSRSAVVLLLVISMFFAPTAFAQQVMSSGTYKIESDSTNFGGSRSTSASYGVEDTVGEISTGPSRSSGFKLFDAGYQGMRTDLPTTANTAPTAPPSLTATALTTHSIELIWGESTDDVAVDRYYIYRNGVKIADVANFPRQYVDDGLSAGTTYTYKVTAVDADLAESSFSSEASATTLSSAVSVTPPSSGRYLENLIITPDERTALVTFDTPSNLIARIYWGTDKTYQSGNFVENSASISHSFVLNNLNGGTLYQIKIVLVGQNGEVTSFENISFRTLSLSTTIAPLNVTDFSLVPKSESIDLSWKNPPVGILGVRIVRSESFYPSTPEDGQTIFEGAGTFYSDQDVVAGKTYYYAIFTKDLAGNFSSGIIGSAKILIAGQEPEVTPPIDTIPDAPETFPQIESLELSDFLFIQHGDILPIRNDTVSVNGSENLTVALRYNRVPKILKTIAVTLTTRDEVPQSFTFILRANRDKTRYEATIAPLGVTTTYTVKITIVNYQNQSFKKIKGTVHVSLAALGALNLDTKKVVGYSLGFLMLLLLAYLVKKFVFRKRRQEVYVPQI